MLKETFTYTDYDGNERTETEYFNLTEAELMELELGISGGFVEMVRSIVEARDTPSLVKMFKEIIMKSYGKKSPDGKRFIKSEELSTAFSQTEAYSQLFMKLATSDEAASRFITGILPKNLANHPDLNKKIQEAKNSQAAIRQIPNE